MMPPLRCFDDLDGKERDQKKTDDLTAMTTLGPPTLQLKKSNQDEHTIYQGHRCVKVSAVIRRFGPYTCRPMSKSPYNQIGIHIGPYINNNDPKLSLSTLLLLSKSTFCQPCRDDSNSLDPDLGPNFL